MTSLEMRDREKTLYDEMRRTYDAADGRSFTIEECERVERITNEIEKNAQDIRATAARESAARALEAPVASSSVALDVEHASGSPDPDGSRWFRDMVEGRADMTLTTEAALVPKELQNRFIELLARVSAVRQAADVYSVAGPVRVARQTGYMTATGFIAEGAAADELSIATEDIEPVFHKGAVDLRFTTELLQDSLLDVTSIAVNSASEGLGKFFEDQYCTGAGGATEFEGLFEAITGANTYSHATTALTCGEITTAMLTELPPQYMGLPRTLILSQAQAANLLSDSSSGDGRLLLQQSATSTFANMPAMSILGTPILISAGAPTTVASDDVLGVLMTQGSYGIYDRGGITIQPDPYTLANTGVTRVIVSMRSSGIVQRPQSIVQIVKS